MNHNKIAKKWRVFMEQELMLLGATFAEVVGRNTISIIGDKITVAKEKKDKESQALAYNEIIDSLLADKQELIAVSRGYKDAYEKITISDEDIEHLHNTLKLVLQIMKDMTPTVKESENSLESLVSLLNKDTLKTMQLLGFNYKEAIGVPLTEACAQAIKSKLKVSNTGSVKSKK